MLSRRTAAVMFGGCLAFGGVVATAGTAFAVDTPPATVAPANPVPSTAAPYTVTIPGVGTLSLTLDPTTGAVSDVLVTPVDGLTAGTPTISTDGVKIVLTAKDGTVHVLEAQVEHSEHGVRIETEVDTENGAQHQEGAQGTSQENDHKGPDNKAPENKKADDHSGDHQSVDGHDHRSNDSHDTSTTASTPVPDQHGDESHSNGDHGSGHDATPGSHGSHD